MSLIRDGLIFSLHKCSTCSKTSNFIPSDILNKVNDLIVISFLTQLPNPTLYHIQQFIADGYNCYGIELPGESLFLPKLYCQMRHDLNAEPFTCDIIVVAKTMNDAMRMFESTHIETTHKYFIHQVYTLVGIPTIFSAINHKKN